VAGCCEHSNAPSRYIKGGEFLDYLSDCQRLSRRTLLHGVGQLRDNLLVFVERIVLLDFIHRLVSQEQTKLRN
jgi:hypothetical protein